MDAICRGQLKYEGTRAETRFRLSAKRTSPFKSAGPQFSRLLAAEVCASVVVMLDTPCSEVVWRVLATHSIRQFPLHFPSLASPCAITFQRESTVYFGITSLYFVQRVYLRTTTIIPLALKGRSFVTKMECVGCEVKVKWSPYRPGVAQRVGRVIALLFHDRGPRRRWVVSSTPRPHFTPGKDPVPIL